MPIDTKELRTRAGHLVLRASFVAEVTLDEARAYQALFLPGGKYAAVGHLITGNITGVSNDVRRVLSDQKTNPDNPSPVAVVLTSAVARMVAGLVMRLASNANTDFFGTEDEALAWLEGKMETYEAKKRQAR